MAAQDSLKASPILGANITFLFNCLGCNMSSSCLLWKTFFNKQYVVFVTVSPLLLCIVLYNTLEVTRKFLNNKGIYKR